MVKSLRAFRKESITGLNRNGWKRLNSFLSKLWKLTIPNPLKSQWLFFFSILPSAIKLLPKQRIFKNSQSKRRQSRNAILTVSSLSSSEKKECSFTSWYLTITKNFLLWDSLKQRSSENCGLHSSKMNTWHLTSSSWKQRKGTKPKPRLSLTSRRSAPSPSRWLKI